MTVRQSIENRFVILVEMWPAYPDYVRLWETQKKHKGRIFTEVLEAAGIVSAPASLAKRQEKPFKYDEAKMGEQILADVAGGERIFSNAKNLKNFSKDLQERAFKGVGFPFTLNKNGLEYEVALMPMHKLVKNVPRSPIRYPTSLEVASRQPVPEEYLDGSRGIVLSPCYLHPDGFTAATFTPFLFTDFEVEDPKLREKFRQITAADLIGRILDDERDGEGLRDAVAEYWGVLPEYYNWMNEVSNKTPFADLNELKQRYERLNLKKYL